MFWSWGEGWNHGGRSACQISGLEGSNTDRCSSGEGTEWGRENHFLCPGICQVQLEPASKGEGDRVGGVYIPWRGAEQKVGKGLESSQHQCLVLLHRAAGERATAFLPRLHTYRGNHREAKKAQASGAFPVMYCFITLHPKTRGIQTRTTYDFVYACRLVGWSFCFSVVSAGVTRTAAFSLELSWVWNIQASPTHTSRLFSSLAQNPDLCTWSCVILFPSLNFFYGSWLPEGQKLSGLKRPHHDMTQHCLCLILLARETFRPAQILEKGI